MADVRIYMMGATYDHEMYRVLKFCLMKNIFK